MITEEAVLNALRKVNDPELHRDLVSLGMVKEIKVDGGAVAVTVELTTPACPMREQVEEETKAAIKTLHCPKPTATSPSKNSSGVSSW
jgi:ATP-binding protein involved in chromosome partitioning